MSKKYITKRNLYKDSIEGFDPLVLKIFKRSCLRVDKRKNRRRARKIMAYKGPSRFIFQGKEE